MSLLQVNGDGKVQVHGHLDRDTLSKNLWDMLSSAEKSAVTKTGKGLVDLSGVERIDSAGLAWLINAVRDGRRHDVDIVFSEVPEKLMKLAKISDVDSLLPIESRT